MCQAAAVAPLDNGSRGTGVTGSGPSGCGNA
jgi:hypothetical protein